MGRKSKSEVRKPEIIKSLYEVLSQEGLEGTTLAKVADRMGVNSGLLVHYFKTKEEMILSMVDYMLEKYAQIYINKLNEYSEPRDRLNNVLNTFFKSEWTERGDASVFWTCFALGCRKARVKQRIREMYRGFRNMLADEIRLYMDAGIVAVTDPVRTADILITMIEGLYFYRRAQGNDMKLSETADYFKQLATDLLIKGS